MGKTLFHKFMKATFYGQFVAGENTTVRISILFNIY